MEETGNNISGYKTTFLEAVKKRFRVDNGLLMIVIMLFIFSILALFSSTSTMKAVSSGRISRLDIATEQVKLVLLGIGIIVFCCLVIYNTKLLRFFSQAGFIASLVPLMIIAIGKDIGPIKVPVINGARRIIDIGFQIQVLEVVKVFMVVYLSWAMDVLKSSERQFGIIRLLYRRTGKDFLLGESFTGFVYVLLPILLITVLSLKASNSGGIIIFAIMFIVIWMGDYKRRDLAIMAVVVTGLLAGAYSVWKLSDGEKLSAFRFGTLENRISSWVEGGNDDKSFDELIADMGGPRTAEARAYIDYKRQEIGTKIAIKEGGIFGKLPGNSTQKYVVPLIFSDYMYSFIIEEYGIFGASLILLLFGMLLARGLTISNRCKTMLPRLMIAGLSALISGQALLHMLLNVGILPDTGQTLPLISDGKSAFVMFSGALGIILALSSVSRKTADKAKPDKATTAAVAVNNDAATDEIYEENEFVED